MGEINKEIERNFSKNSAFLVSQKETFLSGSNQNRPLVFVKRNATRKSHGGRICFGVTFLLLLLAVFSPGFRHTRGVSEPLSPADLEAFSRTILPDGLKLSSGVDSGTPFVGVASSGRAVWKAVLSNVAAPGIRGYAGPVVLLTGIAEPGRVTGVKICSHQETPTFVQGIDSDWFLGQFKEKTDRDALVPFEDVDGITHATVTVEAVCAGVRASLILLSGLMSVESFFRGFRARKSQEPRWRL